MYHLVMAIIIIATTAAIMAFGHQYVSTTSLVRAQNAELVTSEHALLTAAIRSYRQANGVFPGEAAWLDQAAPYLQGTIRTLPDGMSWDYSLDGHGFNLCLADPQDDLGRHDGVALIACSTP